MVFSYFAEICGYLNNTVKIIQIGNIKRYGIAFIVAGILAILPAAV